MFTEQLYPFGVGVGDQFLAPGIVASPDTFAQLTLGPSFRFFARDEDNLYVSYIPYLVTCWYIPYLVIRFIGWDLDNKKDCHLCMTTPPLLHVIIIAVQVAAKY